MGGKWKGLDRRTYILIGVVLVLASLVIAPWFLDPDTHGHQDVWVELEYLSNRTSIITNNYTVSSRRNHTGNPV